MSFQFKLGKNGRGYGELVAVLPSHFSDGTGLRELWFQGGRNSSVRVVSVSTLGGECEAAVATENAVLP